VLTRTCQYCHFPLCFYMHTMTCIHFSGQLVERYQAAVESGKLLPDDHQAACAERLSLLADELLGYNDALAAYRQQLEAYQVCVI